MPGRAASSGNGEGPAMRLLLVEDDRDLNRQLATALEKAGYAVDRAYDGEEGGFLGETEPYDAVILDLGLPIKDGVSLLKEWRAAGRIMPVIALTANALSSDGERCRVAGMDDYIAKPYSLEQLKSAIDRVIAGEQKLVAWA